MIDFIQKTGSGAFEKSDAIPEVKIVFERKREKRFELTKNKLWSGGREAEGVGLLNRYMVEKLYRGFESPPLRHLKGLPEGSLFKW